MINQFSAATLGTKEAQSKNLPGKIYEYSLGEFALAEGKQRGQFYTPGSVVRLLVEILEPYENGVFRFVLQFGRNVRAVGIVCRIGQRTSQTFEN